MAGLDPGPLEEVDHELSCLLVVVIIIIIITCNIYDA